MVMLKMMMLMVIALDYAILFYLVSAYLIFAIPLRMRAESTCSSHCRSVVS